MRAGATHHFAERLNQAIQAHPRCPAKQHGRVSWFYRLLTEEHGMKLAVPSVHKWVNGDAIPTADKVTELAKILSVDEAWLSIGQSQSEPPEDLALVTRAVPGAVLYLAGVIEMEGSTVAFPTLSPNSPDQMPQLYLTQDRAFSSIAVALGVVKGSTVKFHVSVTHNSDRMVGLVRLPGDHFGAMSIFDLTNIDTATAVGSVTLEFSYKGDTLQGSAGTAPRVKAMSGLG